MLETMDIAVLVPCYNEETTIATVVRDFRNCLPDAVVCVYDINSSDQTQAQAHQAGAVVLLEVRQGKGNVVRRMFADIEADIYILVDGDDTYDSGAAPQMLDMMIQNGADIVTARRIHKESAAYRPGHVLRNRLLTGLTALLFNVKAPARQAN